MGARAQLAALLRLRRVGCTLACALLLAACAPPPAPVDTTGVTTTTTPPSEAASSVTGSLNDVGIELEKVARGFEAPLFVTGAGDGSGRLFVVEQGGLVKVVRDGKVQSGAFLDVRSKISAGGERGLLGLAFDPRFETNGRFYVDYTDLDGNTTVARFTASDSSDDSPRLDGPDILLTVEQPFANHNGGCIAFEPGTTRLWVGMGDGGSAGDPKGNAQDPESLLGKMISIDVSRTDPRPVIEQSGVRNPWRFSFDAIGKSLWIGDVGQDAWEEIDVVALDEAAGVNWGWNVLEGTHPYSQSADAESSAEMRMPVFEYPHPEGESVTGGYVYRGSSEPSLVGLYFFGDFEKGWIRVLRPADVSAATSTPQVRTVVPEGTIVLSSFGEDDAGELYAVDYRGTVYRIRER